MNHTELVREFYTSFQNKNWKGMQDCYHSDIVFRDPVFENLKGDEARAMWHMLITAGKDLTLTFNNITTTDTSGTCHWEALYSFSRTGRKVHNLIDASFEFKDGKIFRHTDRFDLWRWSRMALGASGLLLGWSPIVKSKIRSTARRNLDAFMAAQTQYKR